MVTPICAAGDDTIATTLPIGPDTTPNVRGSSNATRPDAWNTGFSSDSAVRMAACVARMAARATSVATSGTAAVHN